MTEQEAAALAARLERVWGDKTVPSENRNQKNDYAFFLHLGNDVCLEHYERFDGRWAIYTSELSPADEPDPDQLFAPLGYISFDRKNGLFVLGSPLDSTSRPITTARRQQFAAPWLSLFRRNCWLSGANIEASAHEKAEWIEGFSREEIEAWNLKM